MHEWIPFYNCHAARILSHHVEQLIVLCCSVISVAAETSRTISPLFCVVRIPIVDCVTSRMCLPKRCSAADVCSGSTIPAFSRNVTIFMFLLNSKVHESNQVESYAVLSRVDTQSL
jgi:hypothetical protein